MKKPSKRELTKVKEVAKDYIITEQVNEYEENVVYNQAVADYGKWLLGRLEEMEPLGQSKFLDGSVPSKEDLWLIIDKFRENVDELIREINGS